MRPLLIPPAAQRDERSIQMLSAWIAEQGLHCTLNVGFFDGQGHQEAEAWGGRFWPTWSGTSAVPGQRGAAYPPLTRRSP